MLENPTGGRGGGGLKAMEILMWEEAQAVLEFQVEGGAGGGGQRNVPSVVKVWIFSWQMQSSISDTLVLDLYPCLGVGLFLFWGFETVT